jgi:hypothetical protein
MALVDILARISSNLPHAWEGDVREPLYTFSVAGETFGFFACSIRQNVEIALVSDPMNDVYGWVVYNIASVVMLLTLRFIRNAVSGSDGSGSCRHGVLDI